MTSNWMLWILASAVVLAVYDLLKKASVRDNAVLPVLMVSTAAGACAYVATLAAAGRIAGSWSAVDARIAALAAVKTVIVGSSWIFTFRALRSLPITIATPIRASAPAVVILLAFFLYGERPAPLQWLGMVLVFAGFFAFSWAGRAEGIDFRRSKAVFFAIGGMLLSAVSALFDKFVFQVAAAPVEPVQLLFQVFLFVFYFLVFSADRLMFGSGGAVGFRWRPTIPFVGIALALADWLYFRALAFPEAQISIGSLLRRFSVAITFFIGAFLFRERNLRRKTLALVFVLAGIVILCGL